VEKATNQIADCHQIGIRSPCCHESSALLYRPPCSRPMYHLLQPVSLPRRPPAAGQKDDLTYKFVSRDGHLHEGPCADLQSICLASMSISFCQLCRHRACIPSSSTTGCRPAVSGRRPTGGAARPWGSRDPLLRLSA